MLELSGKEAQKKEEKEVKHLGKDKDRAKEKF